MRRVQLDNSLPATPGPMPSPPVARPPANVSSFMSLIWHCLSGLIVMGFMSGTAADTFKLSSHISTQREYIPIPLERPQQDPFLHKNGTLDIHALEYHMLGHSLMLDWLCARDREDGITLAPVMNGSSFRRKLSSREFAVLHTISHPGYLPTGVITVGSQTISAIFSTSTSNFLVDSSAYSPHRSQSHPSLTGSNFVIDMTPYYGVTGVVVRDRVVIAGISGVEITFGLANQPLFPRTSQAQAVCGMSMPGSGSVGNLPFFYEMLAQGAVSEPVYAMRLSRRGIGAIYLGGYDEELVWGQVLWMPMASTVGRWIFPGKVQGISAIFSLDSAARFMVMPYNLAQEVFSRLELETRTHHHDHLGTILLASYSCEDPPVFVLQIAGRVINLSPEALNVGLDPVDGRCYLSVYGSQSLEHHVTLGLPFFESTFVVFDVAIRRVGFADPR
ncbi:hypothetical protein V8E36_001692 [Tilletia maclaganii]